MTTRGRTRVQVYIYIDGEERTRREERTSDQITLLEVRVGLSRKSYSIYVRNPVMMYIHIHERSLLIDRI